MTRRNYFFLYVVICCLVYLHFLMRKSQTLSSSSLRKEQQYIKCIGDISNTNVDKRLITVLKDTEKLLIDTEAAVHFGTLLHFYRDCTLLPDTNDIDFALPYFQITDELLTKFKDNGYKLKHTFGEIGMPGYEIAVVHPLGVKVDLFGQVHEEYYSWCPLWVNNKLRHCRYPKSTIDNLRVADNILIKVRQPIEPILASIYGQQWREHVPTRNWNWINPVCT